MWVSGSGLSAFVWARGPEAYRLAGRSVRSLAEAGYAAHVADETPDHEGPAIVALAGAWLRHPQPLGMHVSPELVGLGGGCGWERIQAKSGGDLAGFRQWPWTRLPAVALALVGDLQRFFRAMDREGEFSRALHWLMRQRSSRCVLLPALAGNYDARCRALQVITTTQIGGAERVALDLADELNRQGVATAVASLHQPRRTLLPTPPAFYDLQHSARTPEERAAAIHRAGVQWGADVIHAHLIRGTEVDAIQKAGWPLMVTVHNTSRAWPVELVEARPALLTACAQVVARELHDAGISVPVRTVWNGIVPAVFRGTPERVAQGHQLRVTLAIPEGARVLLVLANPRPQKRLHLLPGILADLLARSGDWHLLLAGEGGQGNADLLERLKGDFAARGLGGQVHWLGAVTRVPEWLAACDALLSTSEWEGLSLAHLEALAAGRQVIATAAGGTGEIAARHPGLRLVPLTSSPEQIAEAVRDALSRPLPPLPFPACFTRHIMARRTRWLYARILPQRPLERPCLWIVSNNFSTGGAQSSARRLLLALKHQGYDVRAAVIQENPDHSTPGRRALEAAGIPVMAVLPPEVADAAEACSALLEAIPDDPGCAVVFWNLITAYKFLLADALLHARVFDVSPGGMLFSSMEKYLASPRADMPWTTARDYGGRLTGFVVKYEREAALAAEVFGAPVHVIPNGLPLPPAGPPRRALRELILATTARISPDKCLHELLAAVRLAAPSLPPFKLRIAGSAEREGRAYARALRQSARGIPVEWCGEVTDIQRFLAAADVFLMISEPAGCPNASIEALAAGLPVIATDHGGASEQVLDGVTGRLVPRADAAAMAAAIIDLAGDFSLRQEMGRAARLHAERCFSIDTMSAAYADLFFGNWTDRVARSAADDPERAGVLPDAHGSMTA